VLSQQAIEGKWRDHDFMRTARLSCYGGLVFAPTITKWYSLLERIQMSNRVKSEPLLSVGSVPQLADPAVSFFK
jgi:protein Mpv17